MVFLEFFPTIQSGGMGLLSFTERMLTEAAKTLSCVAPTRLRLWLWRWPQTHAWVSAPFLHALQACHPRPQLPGGTESSSWGPKGHGPNLQRMISEEAFDLASCP